MLFYIMEKIFVAELELMIETVEIADQDIHIFNIQTIEIDNLDKFKNMFYAGGGEQFDFANSYVNDTADALKSTAWGSILDASGNPYNFNRLGGEHQIKSGIKNPFFIGNPENGVQFWAEEYVIPNYECDLGIEKEKWTTASRMKVEDQLNNLSFVNCGFGQVLITYSSSWEQILFSIGNQKSEANLVISLIIKNGNTTIKDNKLEIIFKLVSSDGTPLNPSS